MSDSGTWLEYPRLLTGAERKQLRDAICEGADRESLAMALADGDPARDYHDIVRPSDFENEVDQLIARALKQGWLHRLIGAFVSQTERADLVAIANAIGDSVTERQLGLGHVAVDVIRTRRSNWPQIAAVVSVLILALVWLFFPEPEPNFKVRLLQGSAPVRSRSVFVSPIVAGDAPSERFSRITDNQGEAFFALAVGTSRFYHFGVKLDNNSECTFPAFSVVDTREVRYELNSNDCRPVSRDVFVRNTVPELPAGLAGVEGRLPTNLSGRRARAPLGLPDAPLVVDRRYYSVGFDPSILSPRWVAFTVDTRRIIRVPRGQTRWTFDPDIPRAWQTGEDPYRNNTYDRGTLVRRTDALVGSNEQEARASASEIFYYSVTVPQTRETNQNTWLAVENYATELSARLGEIYVVAGPVYPDLTRENGAHLTLGPSRTVVPLYLYRVLLRRSADGSWRTLAFLVPNDGSISRNPQQFTTSVAEIERLTGLRFFPEIREPAAEALKENASVATFEG